MAYRRISLNCVTSTDIINTVFKFKFIELNSNNTKSRTLKLPGKEGKQSNKLKFYTNDHKNPLYQKLPTIRRQQTMLMLTCSMCRTT